MVIRASVGGYVHSKSLLIKFVYTSINIMWSANFDPAVYNWFWRIVFGSIMAAAMGGLNGYLYGIIIN